MTQRVEIGGLRVAQPLYTLIEDRVAPGTGIAPADFWAALESLVKKFGPRNKELLAKRDELQTAIDTWHRDHRDAPHDPSAYTAFLESLGYLLPEGEDFAIETTGVDPEIATIAGPQLVVPVTNARFALNAANARWGSLYDALYGTDALPEDAGTKGQRYNPVRGLAVMRYASNFLDEAFPLADGQHWEVARYVLQDGPSGKRIMADMQNGAQSGFADPNQFVGYVDGGEEPKAILLRRHGLHAELQIDRSHPIGKDHPAGLKDVVLESAMTTILDCEDSVAVVDGSDKALAYGNILGLILGDLEASFQKGGKTVSRKLNPDREYTAPDGSAMALPGRSTLLVRNVGHLMTTPAVLTSEGEEIPEGLLDTMATALIFLHDLRNTGPYGNSRTGSVYIVKPKMHGPEEVTFTCQIFAAAEKALGMKPNTLKIGIMDEERRTTLNLKECIRAARERVIFINTGFLDRTGDEIHTDMEAGPVVRKNDMKSETWISAYEDWNVDVGLACGMRGKAQIGKGMWAMPDEMKKMVETKAAHPMAGANCAWVPSPTAATLHAMHYHTVNVAERQAALEGKPRAKRSDLLVLPLLATPPSAEAVQQELDNNIQSILGYVVRWVEQGIGCSKVPDIHDTGLMEDRATLRISSQHIANWLLHGICTDEQVKETLERMAAVVDRQNEGDPNYRPMAADFETSVAFQAASDLIFLGREQPSGYTEPILHAKRLEFKEKNGL